MTSLQLYYKFKKWNHTNTAENWGKQDEWTCLQMTTKPTYASHNFRKLLHQPHIILRYKSTLHLELSQSTILLHFWILPKTHLRVKCYKFSIIANAVACSQKPFWCQKTERPIPKPARRETSRKLLKQMSQGSITWEVNVRRKICHFKGQRTREE